MLGNGATRLKEQQAELLHAAAVAEFCKEDSRHCPRKAPAHAGDIEKFLAGEGLFFFHIQLLHLRDDAPSASKGKAAELEKLPEETGHFFVSIHNSSRYIPGLLSIRTVHKSEESCSKRAEIRCR